MRPSSSLTLEPELDRGFPWGRDLFTFVTSAAGHMMRTLQKPRKNRPSKRQVNHRRFLHNMIQRKFADIEAANHQLASVLFSTEKNLMPNLSTHAAQADSVSRDDNLHDPAKSPRCNTLSDVSKDARSMLFSFEADVRKSKPTHSDHFKRQMDKPITPSRGNSQRKGIHQKTQVRSVENLTEYIFVHSKEQMSDLTPSKELFDEEYFSNEVELQATNNLEKNMCCCSERSLNRFDTRIRTEFYTTPPQAFTPVTETSSSIIPPSCSPEFSPLSLDSCDFSIQTFTDISTCSQFFSSMAGPIEKQHVDILDLVETDVNERSFGCCMETQDCMESIWACQNEADTMLGKENSDYVTFPDQSVSLMELMINTCTHSGSELEQPDCVRGQKGYGTDYGFFSDQGTTERDILTSQDSSHSIARNAGMHPCLSWQEESLTPVQRSNLINYPCYIQDPILPQNSCHGSDGTMLLSNVSHQNCTPFEGVAQSFPAPSQYPQHPPILTPPLEEDWLFADIMEDGEIFGW